MASEAAQPCYVIWSNIKSTFDSVREMTTSYLAFYDYFYLYLKAHGYGESASWFQVFCEGKFESVRCDFSLMLSREMFCEFVVPELQQVCDHMDHSLFNMSSVQHARFIDDLAAIPSLDGIFWNPEPDEELTEKINQAIDTVKANGDYDRISEKWLSL